MCLRTEVATSVDNHSSFKNELAGLVPILDRISMGVTIYSILGNR